MELQQQYELLQERGVEVLAVSSDSQDLVQGLSKRLGFEFPVLYNPEHDVIEQYGVWNLHGDGLAAPAIFIFGRGGTLEWSRISAHAYDHPPVIEVVQIAVSV